MTGPARTCGGCRHANHGTMDAREGLWACPWTGATDPESECVLRYEGTSDMVHEPYDGANCTWGTGDSVFRSVPRGYEGRPVVRADP
jgi:hypothetical protein